MTRYHWVHTGSVAVLYEIRTESDAAVMRAVYWRVV